MKKLRIVFPALLLVCAGMVMTSCPSDPEPVKKAEDPNMTLEAGTFRYVFTEPRIEHGKEYEVIFRIISCDEDLYGSRPGGKICYKMNLNDTSSGAEKLLSGWTNSTPEIVTANMHTYKWTFKAGQKNNDGLDVETDATTPDGATQYFALTIQDKDWHDYDSSYSFDVKGEFEVRLKETITNWVSAGEVTLGNEEGTAGKGALTEADMTKIRALPPRSVIRITVSVNVDLNGSTRPTYGVCSVGGWEEEDSLPIKVPVGTPGGDQTFTVEFEIADLLTLQPAGYQIAINPYNGATVTKAELFRPGP